MRTLLLLLSAAIIAAEPWPTYRGNPQRTGNIDNIPGPAVPKVLWVHKAKDHFLAALVPGDDRIFVPGLAGLNNSLLLALPLDAGNAPPKPLWAKTVPELRLPIVSSPALVDGKIFFGDGMHQHDGGSLYCLAAADGKLAWEWQLAGKLVHFEAGPTVIGKRAYIGAGAGGFVAVDTEKLALDGKDITPAEAAKMRADKWAALLAEYEQQKKKDPDFAVPPTEDKLPRPAPKVLWRVGDQKTYAGAPLAVADGKVYAASIFLDKEKLGERALFCLDAETGAVKWRKPMTHNPWSGATLVDGMVIVAGSSAGYYLDALKGAKGEIAAFDAVTGEPKWRKDVPAGIIASVTATGGMAIATATDGKLRAFDLKTGERRWIYDANLGSTAKVWPNGVKAPLFGPPATVGGAVYIADVNGVVHAVGLKDGRRQWAFDLGSDPAVKAPGMVYGGVTVQGGKLFVATCNLEGPFARQETVVVCIGGK